MLLTLSLVTLGLVSNWPLSVMCKMPPEQISWNSTLPFSRRAIFTYWWDKIFWYNWAGTWEDISSTPKRSVSSPKVKLGKLIELSDISRTWIIRDTFGLLCGSLQRNVRLWENLFKINEISKCRLSVGACRKRSLHWITFLGSACRRFRRIRIRRPVAEA